MWLPVHADQTELVERCTQLVRLALPVHQFLDFSTAVAALRSSVARGAPLYYGLESDFDCCAHYSYMPRRAHWHLCVGFEGSAAPQDVLDLLLSKIDEFAQQQQITEMFAVQSKEITYQPLAQLFQLLTTDPRIVRTVVSDEGDALLLKLELAAA